jgi:hypothetical protein
MRLVKRVTEVSLAVALLIWQPILSTATDGPTLEQAVAYIEFGGAVAISQMKQLDDHTVAIPPAEILVPTRLETIDKEHCIFEITSSNGKSTLYYGTIIFDRTSVQPMTNGNWRITLQSNGKAFCSGNDPAASAEGYCRPTEDINVRAGSIDSIKKALNYVFTTFCTPAKGDFD